MKKLLILTALIIGMHSAAFCAEDYYWVGGSGSWFNPFEHWSYTSGGEALNTGAGQPPGLSNNVYFDNNSFADADTIAITFSEGDANDVVCKTLDFRGVTDSEKHIVFNVPSGVSFRIYGSFYLIENMQFSVSESIQFLSSELGEEIETRGNRLSDVRFNNSGEWTVYDSKTKKGRVNTIDFLMYDNCSIILADSLAVREINQRDSSRFNTNDQHLYLSSTYGSWGGIITFGKSIIDIENAFYIGNLVTVDAGTSLVRMHSSNSLDNDGNETFHNVEFVNSTSTLQDWGSYNHVIFRGGGNIIGSNTYDSLTLTPGNTYTFNSNTEQTINEYFSADGVCENYIYLTSDSATISKADGDVSVKYCIIENIKAEGAKNFTAENSIEMGTSPGWNFAPSTPRQLWWVNRGVTNSWNDPDNWSDAGSGGTEGACPPTPYDDVFFDNNSGLLDDTVIVDNNVMFCHDMDWRGLTENAYFRTSGEYPVRVFGSMWLSDSLNTSLSDLVNFLSSDTGEEIETRGNHLPDVRFNNSGEWTVYDSKTKKGRVNTIDFLMYDNCSIILADSLAVREINQRDSSRFNTNDQHLYLSSTYGSWGGIITFGKSIIDIENAFYIGNLVTVDAGTSLVRMHSSNSLDNDGNETFHNVEFVNSTSTLQDWGSYNHVIFRGGAYIEGSNTYDSLTLTPGNTYTLSANSEQTINEYLWAKGNNCYRIVLHSDAPGAAFVKDTGDVVCDFLELQNIRAEGGAEFYAGQFSYIYGSNPGWIFENAPGYIYGFGPEDTTICEGNTLETFNFNNAQKYLWHDGSTESFHVVDESGLYWVAVTYGDSCIFEDSIFVNIIDNANIDLGPDRYVCEGNTPVDVSADIQNAIAPYYISWQPAEYVSDSTAADVTLSAPVTTRFFLYVYNKNMCVAVDTVDYIVVESVKPLISKSGIYLVSSIPEGNQWYLDGEKIEGARQQKIVPFKNGVYTVQVISNLGCISEFSEPLYMDELNSPAPILILGTGEAQPGESVEIPIYVNNYDSLLIKNINQIHFLVTFNKSLLYPEETGQPGNVDSDTRTITATAYYTVGNGADWGKLRFTAALGDAEYTNLTIDTVLMADTSFTIYTMDGYFALEEICREGGERLFADTDPVYLSSLSPNPVSDAAELSYRIIDKTALTIDIVDIYGEVVKTAQSGQKKPGYYSEKIDCSDIASGVYFLRFSSSRGVVYQKFLKL